MTGIQWNSLDRLKAALAALIVADLFFLAALFAAQHVHRNQLQTIGRDSAPSIIAAQHIKVAIADMDAEAANELLAKPGAGSEAFKAYSKRREEAADALISAAQNITYGDAERIPIKELQIGLGEYEIAIQRARDLHERSDPQAVSAFESAARTVDQRLFPAADALDRANFDVLEQTFESGRSLVTATRICIVIAWFLLLLILAYVQWDLIRRVRRLLNPALLAASILTLGLGGFAIGRLSLAAEDLRIAKQDAFTSIHALWQARAVAYSANADESKYLLYKDASPAERAFFGKAAKIWSEAGKGFLGEELANITFPGEKESATETIKRWRAYLRTDAQIRQLQKTGKRDEAIALCLGRNPDESDWEFSRLDEALGKTIDINQHAFDDSVSRGFEQLAGLNWFAAIGAAAIAGLCISGLLARIREFL